MPTESNALRALVGSGRTSPPSFAQAPPRVRPGDRPVWVDLPLTTAQATKWRARATAVRLPLDVWLGLLLEYHLIHERLLQLGGTELSRAVSESVNTTSEAPRLAPTVELRLWIEQLDGSDRARDDLPSVVLPARLLAQLPHEGRADAISVAAESGCEAEAVGLDRVAACNGLTAEAWAYLAALRLPQ
jgi:hypothetical protein